MGTIFYIVPTCFGAIISPSSENWKKNLFKTYNNKLGHNLPPHATKGRDARTWPARYPDLTPCDYFLWGYVKDKLFVPPQPVSILDLKNGITAAVETITPDLLSRLWQELDYRLDVCRVTKGAYIEHL